MEEAPDAVETVEAVEAVEAAEACAMEAAVSGGSEPMVRTMNQCFGPVRTADGP